MNIALESGAIIRGDGILSAVIRYDLVPVPATLEVTCRLDEDILPHIAEGKTVISGRHDEKYRIVKFGINNLPQTTQGARPFATASFLAILESVHKIAFLQGTATIKDSSSFGTIYRACGATAKVLSDLPVGAFACFAGDHPAKHVARLLQEESAVVAFDGKGIGFYRIADLMQRKPVRVLDTDTTESLTSEFVVRHEVPGLYGRKDIGGIEKGETESVRRLDYNPTLDKRALTNSSKCLINRKKMRIDFAPDLMAGDILDIAGSKQAIITAAHAWSAKEAYSMLWLGTPS